MPRPRGIPKTGGRSKGTPNKRSAILSEILDGLNFDVPQKLVELLPILTPDKQADVLVDLMKYLFPVQRSIDAPVDHNIKQVVQDNRQQLLVVMSDPESLKAAKIIAEKVADERS